MALSAQTLAPKRGEGAIPDVDHVPIAANVIIYKNGIVGMDANGNAIPATSTAADKLSPALGISADNYDNTSPPLAASQFIQQGDGTAGGGTNFQGVKIYRGVFGFVNSAGTDAVTAADKGEVCYVVDDQTVARTSNNGNRVPLGIVEAIGDGTFQDGTAAAPYVYVRVGTYVPKTQCLDIMLVAAADLTGSQGLFIKVDTNGKAALAAAGDPAIGVLMNAPAAAAIARVRVAGIARVVAGGAVTRGDRVASDASAKAKTAVTATTDTTAGSDSATAPLKGSNIVGIALETGVLNSLMSILLSPSGAVPTTAQ